MAHNRPILLPRDLRDGVGEDDVVLFIIAAVEQVDAAAVRCNARGTDSAKCPPNMMLALLIYWLLRQRDPTCGTPLLGAARTHGGRARASTECARAGANWARTTSPRFFAPCARSRRWEWTSGRCHSVRWRGGKGQECVMDCKDDHGDWNAVFAERNRSAVSDPMDRT